jgi:hypothetical protein
MANGEVLDAEFSVVDADGHLDLILESAGGNSAGRPARNPDYRETLGLLLYRLRGHDATIEDALVDSRYTQQEGIPAAERRLIDGPVRPADVEDLTMLRGQLNTRQSHIGQMPGASGGNTTKRIRLQLALPDFGPGDGDLLAERLADLPRAGIAEVVEALRDLRLQRGPDDLIKRHQPLTLLWAIGRAWQGRPRLVPWPEAKTSSDSSLKAMDGRRTASRRLSHRTLSPIDRRAVRQPRGDPWQRLPRDTSDPFPPTALTLCVTK